MDIHPISNDADLSKAIATIEDLWGSEPGTPNGNALNVLITLVDLYENERYPISETHPIEVIKTHMEMTGKTQADLASLIGSASRASELLHKRRALTIEMVDKLHSGWGIPAEYLVKPYPLERPKTESFRSRPRKVQVSRRVVREKKRA